MISKFKLLLGVGLFTLTFANGQAPAAGAAAIKGSPYLDDAYVDGVVYYGNKTLKAPMRYNAFQDLMEYQQNGKQLVLDPSETITKVTLGNSTFASLKYNTDGKTKFGYFVMLDSGKVALFAKKEISFTPVRKGRAQDGSDEPAQYKRSPDAFYYKVGDGTLQEVGAIKEMIATFPDKQEELAQYAKKEKISAKKEKEIVQFVQYYNSL